MPKHKATSERKATSDRVTVPVRVPAKEEVTRRMATLHGQSRADLERDAERGAGSPLGGGTGAMKRNPKRKGASDAY